MDLLELKRRPSHHTQACTCILLEPHTHTRTHAHHAAQAPLLELFARHADAKGKQAKLKSPAALQELLDAVRQLLADMESSVHPMSSEAGAAGAAAVSGCSTPGAGGLPSPAAEREREQVPLALSSPSCLMCYVLEMGVLPAVVPNNLLC